MNRGQSDREILSSRVIDRTVRPLFPRGFMYGTQVTATLLSYDPDCEPEPVRPRRCWHCVRVSVCPCVRVCVCVAFMAA